MTTLYGVKNKNGLFLNIRQFDKHKNPIWGGLGESWITTSKEKAITQASFLDDDAKAVEYVLTK